ncbi:MAG: hypothetical protein Q8R15_00175 [Candidatus Micrarchaeota archaeon]|nr:hypothetical protein [Candidatus Micrarchaeota archaeon]
MSKPRIVDIKKPEVVKKPRVVGGVVEPKETEEDYSLILEHSDTGDASQALRKQQLRDIMPNQPKPGQPIQALGDDVRQKIEEDRKKRRGLAGGVKDLLGLK